MVTKNWCLSLGIAAFVLSGMGTGTVNAVERRKPQEIPANELLKETQVANSMPHSVDFVWWIPSEYWDSTSSASASRVFRSVFIIAVVQADISPFGNFNFFSKPTIQRGLKVTYTDSNSNALVLKPTDKVSDNVSSFLMFIQPIITRTVGKFGENISFFVYNTLDSSGKRIASPYESGNLKISLSDKNGVQRSEKVIEFPLNSLFVPRICPNGKPAHISWKYCPWDGTRLSE
jgi:hypothetical protein